MAFGWVGFLREHGRVFAIDERELVALVNADRAARRTSLLAAIVDSGLEAEVAAVERLWTVHAGAAPGNATDRRMAHLVTMFTVLNTCGRNGCVAPDEAHDRLNKDAALKERYCVLRAAG